MGDKTVTPFNPEPVTEETRDRYERAVTEKIFEFSGDGDDPEYMKRSGGMPERIFDFPDGMRLIVERVMAPKEFVGTEGMTAVHVSASVFRGTSLMEDRMAGKISPVEILTLVVGRWMDLARLTGDPPRMEIVISPAGIPHLLIPDPEPGSESVN